jgi:hypothetical protein
MRCRPALHQAVLYALLRFYWTVIFSGFGAATASFGR